MLLFFSNRIEIDSAISSRHKGQQTNTHTYIYISIYFEQLSDIEFEG